MAHLVVMYKTPKDAAAFDKHYAEKHIQIAKKIPDLRKYEISRGPVATPAGPSSYHLVALFHFDNLAANFCGIAPSTSSPPLFKDRRQFLHSASSGTNSPLKPINPEQNKCAGFH